jgi:hypothetical protein
LAAILRFLQFLSLGCWLGSIIFFIVFTQGIFSVMPTKDLAGVIVGYSLARLHILGIVAGCLYLIATVAVEKSILAIVRRRPKVHCEWHSIACTSIRCGWKAPCFCRVWQPYFLPRAKNRFERRYNSPLHLNQN